MKIEKYIEILEKLKSKIIDMTDYKELNYNSRCLAIEKFEYLVTDASYEKICKKLHKEFVKELELDEKRASEEYVTIQELVSQKIKIASKEEVSKNLEINKIIT